MAGKYTWNTTLKEMKYQVWRHHVEHHTDTVMFAEKFQIEVPNIQLTPKVAGVFCKDLNVESEEEFARKAKFGIKIFCLTAKDIRR